MQSHFFFFWLYPKASLLSPTCLSQLSRRANGLVNVRCEMRLQEGGRGNGIW